MLSVQSQYAAPGFEAGEHAISQLEDTRLLIAGAGGLGCELLKDLVKIGFCNIDIIDMDTIDISNLNRQFLFTELDIGKPKAVVAAEYVLNRVSHKKSLNINAHFKKLQDFPMNYYSQFNIIVCGLDSVIARRFMNSLVHGLLKYDREGNLDPSSVIPIVDGGTEGLKGNARVIYPTYTACIECSIQTYPKQVTYPLCTLASTPRLPEHCVEYVRMLLWPKAYPGVVFDGDNAEHVLYIYERALERANEFNIQGVTYRFTLGVVKNIVPAIASTNAIIAGVCANEVFKLVTQCAQTIDNYIFYNGEVGLYSMAYPQEKDPDCIVCHTMPLSIITSSHVILSQLIDLIKTHPRLAIKGDIGLRMAEKSLYLSNPPELKELTKHNLSKQLTELDIHQGSKIIVSAASELANPITVIINYE